MRNITTVLRDALLLFLFAFLILTAYKRLQKFVALHQHSMIHELDRTFTDQLYSTQKQLRSLEHELDRIGIDNTYDKQIAEIRKSLELIEDQYVKNSPGVLFLGPIGTTSIVLKEQQLTQRLLKQVNLIGKLVNEVLKRQDILNEAFKPAPTIDTGLSSNQDNIHLLR